MTPLWIALAALVGTAVTGVVTWAVARRNASGSVETSEADQLWSESKIIRQELRAEAVSLRMEAAALRAEVTVLRAEVMACNNEAVHLQSRLTLLERKRREVP